MQKSSPIIAFVTWGSDDTYTHAFNSGEALQVKELYDKSRRSGETCGFSYTYVDINLQKDI